MAARLDLLAHGASTATRAARFPDDEALEASAHSALEALRGQLRPYAHALTSPARAARETAAALGFEAKVEMALSGGPGLSEARRRRMGVLFEEALEAEIVFHDAAYSG